MILRRIQVHSPHFQGLRRVEEVVAGHPVEPRGYDDVFKGR